MRLKLVPVPALSSRQEVFFEPSKRRRGTRSIGKEISLYRVPRVPPLSPEHRALVDLRRELDLSDTAAARALGLRVAELQALERGELQPRDPTDWSAALEALRRAADHQRGAASSRG